MPVTPTFPGVYIEEVPSTVHTIVGVATSITAFIGRAPRGLVNDPLHTQSFADYERSFGGLSLDSTMSYAVKDFFLNGGTDAVIVRVHNPSFAGADDLATIAILTGGAMLTLEAANPGTWGNNLRVSVDHHTKDVDTPMPDQNLFNLVIEEIVPGTEPVVVTGAETFPNLSRDANDARFVTKVLERESAFVRVRGTIPLERPDATASPIQASGGDDGQAITDAQISDPDLENNKQGLFALKKVDLFNLLCIPPLTREQDIGPATRDAALKFCTDRRAMFIVDPPSEWNAASDVTDTGVGLDSLSLTNKKNGAIYFPRVRIPDPLRENRLEEFPPCGVVAGVIARTDAQRGVFKAPAGLEATLTGVQELTVKLTDGEQGQLNPIGVNCLRTFPIVGSVVWGARTLEGADRLTSEWKYLPVRRLALFIEESLYRGTQFAVFEPNDEPLWAQLRLNIGAFMQNLFRQGAFQGTSPRQAYFVKVDSETTTQNDIDQGIVNLLVGFAPLKPAEFVIIQIQQMAGQVQT